jgi:hypothetical protein
MSKILLTLRMRPQVTGDALSTSDCPWSKLSACEPSRELNRPDHPSFVPEDRQPFACQPAETGLLDPAV